MNKAKFLFVAFTTIVLLTFGAIWAFHAFMGKRPYAGPRQPTRPRAEVEAACQAHVEVAATKAREVIWRRSEEFRDFIDARKSGAQPFSEDMVSLYGKWRAVSTYLPRPCMDNGKWDAVFSPVTGLCYFPGRGKDNHKKYVIDKFAQHLFSVQDLTATMKRSIEGAVKDTVEYVYFDVHPEMPRRMREAATSGVPSGASRRPAGHGHDAARGVCRLLPCLLDR